MGKIEDIEAFRDRLSVMTDSEVKAIYDDAAWLIEDPRLDAAIAEMERRDLEF